MEETLDVDVQGQLLAEVLQHPVAALQPGNEVLDMSLECGGVAEGILMVEVVSEDATEGQIFWVSSKAKSELRMICSLVSESAVMDGVDGKPGRRGR